MSGKNFGSWPTYNTRKVLLEDDTRLVKAPQTVALQGTWSMTLSGASTVLDSEQIVDFTGVSDVRLEYGIHATTTFLLSTTPSAIYLLVDYTPVSTVAWQPLVSGSSVTSGSNQIGISSWTTVASTISQLGDVRLRVRALGTSGANAGGIYTNLAMRYTSALVGGSAATGNRSFAQVLINFARATAGEDNFVRTTVAAPWVTTGMLLIAQPAATVTSDHDEEDAAVDGVSAYVASITPGVGFDLVATAANSSWGRYLFNVVAF